MRFRKGAPGSSTQLLSPPLPKEKGSGLLGLTYNLSRKDSKMSLGQRSARRHSTTPADSVIAQGPYYNSRPTLEDIITDTAPAPWTLNAFTTYCEQNLCLENLQFTMDARRYETMYKKMMADGDECSTKDSPRNVELLDLWHDLLRTYIQSRSPQEINLPGQIRESLASASVTDLAPPPRLLHPALSKIYELMQDSILMPFLNDMAQPGCQRDGNLDAESDPLEARRSTGSIPAGTTLPPTVVPRRPPTSSPRQAPRPKTEAFFYRPKSLLSSKEQYSSGNSSATDSWPLEETSSLGSPAPTMATSTPPNTPPLGDTNRRLSPRSRSDAAWAKMSRKLGFNKKRHGSDPKDDYAVE